MIDGKAVAELDSGVKYEGPVVDGAYTGNGTLTWPNGDKYTGQVMMSKQHGQGFFI